MRIARSELVDDCDIVVSILNTSESASNRFKDEFATLGEEPATDVTGTLPELCLESFTNIKSMYTYFKIIESSLIVTLMR